MAVFAIMIVGVILAFAGQLAVDGIKDARKRKREEERNG